ncbi:MAG: head GIN domain-containing protein [Ferruginibacter sp.]
MKKLLLSLVVLVSLQAFAQHDAVMNDANVQKRNLNAGFSAIYVSDGVELYLTQGNEESIAISVSDNKYLDRFKTEVSNGTLKIYYDNKGINRTGNEKRKLKAYVSFKMLEKLDASGGAQVSMKSSLTANKLECTFTSGSTFNGQVKTNELNIGQSSGSQVNMTGETNSLKVDASSGAIFKGYDLTVDVCDAQASSGAGVRVSVNKELTVKASSGGGIRYKGNGVIREMNVSSGGIVKKG